MSVADIFLLRRLRFLPLPLLLAPCAAAQAATIISASSTAFQGQLRLSTGGTGTIAPGGIASGTAPPAFSNSSNASDFGRNADVGPTPIGPLFFGFGATTVAGIAQSDTQTASASIAMTYTGFGVLIAQTVTRDTFLGGISAWGLGSSTIFDGTNFVGSTNFDEMYVNRDNFDNLFYSNGTTTIAPNSVVWDQDGYRIVLNEQIFTDETTGGATVRSLTTNAYHVTFTNYIGSLSGDVIAGQSRVSVTTAGEVPEPATWAMMIAGFGLIGAALRRPIRPASALAGTSAR